MMSSGLAMELASALRLNGVQNIRISIDIHPNLRAINTLSSHYIEKGNLKLSKNFFKIFYIVKLND